MAQDPSPETFTQIIIDPASWMNAGEKMYLAAQVLASQLRGPVAIHPADDSLTFEPPLDLRKSPLPPNPYIDWRVDLLWPIALLLGFAAENFLKAAYVKVLGLANINGPLTELPKPLQTHKLTKVADNLPIRFDDLERELMIRLTPVVQWAGRYAVPTKATESVNIHLLSTDDLRTVQRIRHRVQRFLTE